MSSLAEEFRRISFQIRALHQELSRLTLRREDVLFALLTNREQAPSSQELPSLLPRPDIDAAGPLWCNQEYTEEGPQIWTEEGAIYSAQHAVGVPRRAEMLSMQGQLLTLNSQEDPDLILVVKESLSQPCTVPLTETLLASHFRQFGEVQQVQIHIRNLTRRDIARQGLPPDRTCFRLGFVVMQTSDAARSALDSGAEHVIGGCGFRVEKFREKQRCFSAGGGYSSHF